MAHTAMISDQWQNFTWTCCRRQKEGLRCWGELEWRKSTSLAGNLSWSSRFPTIPDQVDFQPSHRNHLDYWHDSRLLQRRALLHCVKAECCLFWFSLGLNPKRIFTLEICPRGGRYLGEMVRFCKEELDIESVTVVTNGSKVVSQETHPP